MEHVKERGSGKSTNDLRSHSGSGGLVVCNGCDLLVVFPSSIECE